MVGLPFTPFCARFEQALQKLSPLIIHENRVRYFRMMKNITLSADESLIQQARRLANSENKNLNDFFREWLARYVAQPGAEEQYLTLMSNLNHVQSGQSFSREAMNEHR